MSDDDARLDRARQLYWNLLIELKTSALFSRLYADDQGRWMKRIGILKAIATSSTIAGWSIWKDQALVWAIILASAQLLDAVKEFLPNQKRQRAASEWASAAEILSIEAQVEYEALAHGEIDTAGALSAWERLAKRQREGEQRHFPDGTPKDGHLNTLALDEARAYFARNYPGGGQP